MKKMIPLSALSLLALLPVQAPAADNPHAAPKEAQEQKAPAENLSGKVVETMNGGGYTYVLLEKGGKKTWVAVPEMNGVKVGQEMSFGPGMEMRDFRSKALNRTFESILFSNGPAVQPESTKGKTSPGSKGSVVSPSEKIKVEKAKGANAYTVAELFGQKAKLDKKNVVVRGKVTKVASGIMGKNWIHLQDGTGDQKKGTHDIVVTSQDLPAIGDVITVSGKLAKDKDFGGGYKYEVIVEEGTVKH